MPTTVSRPCVDTVATLRFVLSQVARSVTSADVPSDSEARAVSWTDSPGGRDSGAFVIARDTAVGALGGTVVVVVTLGEVAGEPLQLAPDTRNKRTGIGCCRSHARRFVHASAIGSFHRVSVKE